MPIPDSSPGRRPWLPALAAGRGDTGRAPPPPLIPAGPALLSVCRGGAEPRGHMCQATRGVSAPACSRPGRHLPSRGSFPPREQPPATPGGRRWALRSQRAGWPPRVCSRAGRPVGASPRGPQSYPSWGAACGVSSADASGERRAVGQGRGTRRGTGPAKAPEPWRGAEPGGVLRLQDPAAPLSGRGRGG